MIYVDTSVVLAEVLEEPRQADDLFWQKRLVSSRLLEYEAWVRLHAYDVDAARAELRNLLGDMAALKPCLSGFLPRGPGSREAHYAHSGVQFSAPPLRNPATTAQPRRCSGVGTSYER